jgi:hypothetical protein
VSAVLEQPVELPGRHDPAQACREHLRQRVDEGDLSPKGRAQRGGQAAAGGYGTGESEQPLEEQIRTRERVVAAQLAYPVLDGGVPA